MNSFIYNGIKTKTGVLYFHKMILIVIPGFLRILHLPVYYK